MVSIQVGFPVKGKKIPKVGYKAISLKVSIQVGFPVKGKIAPMQ